RHGWPCRRPPADAQPDPVGRVREGRLDPPLDLDRLFLDLLHADLRAGANKTMPAGGEPPPAGTQVFSAGSSRAATPTVPYLRPLPPRPRSRILAPAQRLADR